ncbi:MAG: hypothetical protein K1X88_29390, partial [Nannocystaceae bacterium]|nr:hypothetical protein [Nannocystaceae bacterium]
FEAVQLLASRGYVRMTAGDPAGAVADAREATAMLDRVAPDNVGLAQTIASNEAAALRADGRCPEAITVLERAMARDPERSLTVTLGNLGELAVAQAECGERAAALASMAAAIAGAPPTSRLRANLALAEATIRDADDVAARATSLMLARAIAVRDGDAALLARIDEAERRDYSRVR